MCSKRVIFSFDTIYNQSYLWCFLLISYLIFKYNKWARDHVYSGTVHLALTYNFNAYLKQVSMSVTLTLRQQQWWCQQFFFNFAKQIFLKIKGVHSRILTPPANIYNGCLSPIKAIIYNGCLSLSYWSHPGAHPRSLNISLVKSTGTEKTWTIHEKKLTCS